MSCVVAQRHWRGAAGCHSGWPPPFRRPPCRRYCLRAERLTALTAGPAVPLRMAAAVPPPAVPPILLTRRTPDRPDRRARRGQRRWRRPSRATRRDPGAHSDRCLPHRSWWPGLVSDVGAGPREPPAATLGRTRIGAYRTGHGGRVWWRRRSPPGPPPPAITPVPPLPPSPPVPPSPPARWRRRSPPGPPPPAITPVPPLPPSPPVPPSPPARVWSEGRDWLGRIRADCFAL